MVYLIQYRMVWILYTDRDLGEKWTRLFFPSIRNEHKWPPMVIHL